MVKEPHEDWLHRWPKPRMRRTGLVWALIITLAGAATIYTAVAIFLRGTPL